MFFHFFWLRSSFRDIHCLLQLCGWGTWCGSGGPTEDSEWQNYKDLSRSHLEWWFSEGQFKDLESIAQRSEENTFDSIVFFQVGDDQKNPGCM